MGLTENGRWVQWEGQSKSWTGQDGIAQTCLGTNWSRFLDNHHHLEVILITVHTGIAMFAGGARSARWPSPSGATPNVCYWFKLFADNLPKGILYQHNRIAC